MILQTQNYEKKLLCEGTLSLERTFQMSSAAETVKAQSAELNKPKGVIYAVDMKEYGQKKPPCRTEFFIKNTKEERANK